MPPVRKLWDFLLGYAPFRLDALKLSKLRHPTLLLASEALGRSPETKEYPSRKGRAASAHRAAQPRRVVLEDL
jgi:hypothetical protein